MQQHAAGAVEETHSVPSRLRRIHNQPKETLVKKTLVTAAVLSCVAGASHAD